MEIELLIAIFAGVFAGIGILLRLSFQVGRFIQRIEFVEASQKEVHDSINILCDRVSAVERKLPFTVIRGSRD